MMRRPPRPPLFPYTTLSRSPDLRLDALREWARLEARVAAAPLPPGARRPRPPLLGRALRFVARPRDRKSTRLNSSHSQISYAVFCLKKKKHYPRLRRFRREP